MSQLARFAILAVALMGLALVGCESKNRTTSSTAGDEQDNGGSGSSASGATQMDLCAKACHNAKKIALISARRETVDAPDELKAQLEVQFNEALSAGVAECYTTCRKRPEIAECMASARSISEMETCAAKQ